MARSKSTTKAATAPELPSEAPAERPEPVTLTGRLCADPVLRHTASGKAVTTIRIAVNAPDAEATFHSIVVWERTAEVVCQYMRKGRRVEVTGRPKQRTYTDTDGVEHTVAEISASSVQFLARTPGQQVTSKEVA